MRIASFCLFLVGAAIFVGSLFLPWEGLQRVFRDGRREEITFIAFSAQEEAQASAVLGIGVILLSLATSWMQKGILAIGVIEILLLIGLAILIYVHAKDALSYHVNAPNYIASGIRVFGPHVGLGACGILLVSRIARILGRNKEPAN